MFLAVRPSRQTPENAGQSLHATNSFSKDLNDLLSLLCISAPKEGSFLCAVPLQFKSSRKIQYFGVHKK